MTGSAALKNMNISKDTSYYQIESVLHNYPKVLEAGVIVSSLSGQSDILQVYLALEESFSTYEERERYCNEVENFIHQTFSLKMPIKVQIREKLPMTKSGKILRSVLRNY